MNKTHDRTNLFPNLNVLSWCKVSILCILLRRDLLLVTTPVKHLAVLATDPSLARVPNQTGPSGGGLQRFLHASSESRRIRAKLLLSRVRRARVSEFKFNIRVEFRETRAPLRELSRSRYSVSFASWRHEFGILNFCAIVSAGNWPRSNKGRRGRLELTLSTWPVSCRLRRTPSRAFDSPGKRSSVCTSPCHPRRARLPVPVSTNKGRTVITLKPVEFKLCEEIYRIINSLTSWKNIWRNEFKFIEMNEYNESIFFKEDNLHSTKWMELSWSLS